MKNLLRVSVLTAAVALTALLPARAIPLVNCETACFNSGGVPKFTHVFWSTTASQCCSLTGAPCPAGAVPTSSSYTSAGRSYLCPV